MIRINLAISVTSFIYILDIFAPNIKLFKNSKFFQKQVIFSEYR